MINLTYQKLTVREIVQNTFSPLVGVITSPAADEICITNNLTFTELLQPFAKLSTDGHFRDNSGTSVSIRGLRLNFCDVDWRPPQEILVKKILNEVVANSHKENTKIMSAGNINVEVPADEPWFDHWRETFLTVQYPSDHEFTRHFLSCLIVLSTNDANIVDTAHKLFQRVFETQNVTPQKLPKWFNPNDVLNSYVILHDSRNGDLSRAQQSYELLKSTFGDSKCFLIQINSKKDENMSETINYWAPFIKFCGQHNMGHMEFITDPKVFRDTDSISSSSNIKFVNDKEDSISHPLSPLREHTLEQMSSNFSESGESLFYQTGNICYEDFERNVQRGKNLNGIDIENIRHFVQDYTVRALIPYIECLVVTLNETVANKKGVSKSLLSATKRWFVTNKPGIGTNAQNGVIYTNESVELQTRKLGDLYFMFGHYNLAFQAYHQAKRDFNADSAWQYYAGALEMASLSAFMLGTANRKTFDYMEDAIICYLTVCKLQHFATRATLLNVECLKASNLYTESAKQLIRMTNENSDLRSALLLEQAAYCFLMTQPSMFRKYSFHIVLAGNRYSRAGQRNHAFRCYRQAYSIFVHRGWSLAEDHIQYTIGKQAYLIRKLKEASESFSYLLRPSSMQSVQQQTNFLKDYIQTQNELINQQQDQDEVNLIPLSLPKIIQNSIRVLVSADLSSLNNNQFESATNISIDSDLSDECVWNKLEKMTVQSKYIKSFGFKPPRSLYTNENPTTEHPLAVQGEVIEIAVTILNPLKCGLNLNDIDILWQLKLENGDQLSNNCLFLNKYNNSSNIIAVKAAINTCCNKSIVLGENEKKKFIFKLTPKLPGMLNITGIIAKLAPSCDPSTCLLGSLNFEQQIIKNIYKSKKKFFDSKLLIRVIPPVPALKINFSVMPTKVLAGEIVPVSVILRNTSIISIEEIILACEYPRWITINNSEKRDLPIPFYKDFENFCKKNLSKDKEIFRQHIFRLNQPTKNVALEGQETTSFQIWLQAPFEKGECVIRLLFYYTLPEKYNKIMKCRLIRHCWRFNVHECLKTEATVIVSNTQSEDLSLNVNIKNEQTDFNNTELYINSISIYSPKFKLNSDKYYVINQKEILSGKIGDFCLNPSTSATFQCRLDESTTIKNDYENPTQLLRDGLSTINITTSNLNSNVSYPKLDEMHSFLVKHETIFLNQNISTEEFNLLLCKQDPHLTVIISWNVSILTENSTPRVANGQHFIQLRKICETGTCPQEKDRKVAGSQKLQLVPIFSLKSKPRSSDKVKRSVIESDINDFWKINNCYENFRCLPEDENFTINIKAHDEI